MSTFEKWAIDYGLDYESSFTRDDVEAAWQAAKADSEQEIAELKAKVSELDGRLGSRNLHKEHEYLQRMNELQANINVLREDLEKLAGTNGYVKSVALQALASTPAQSLLQHDNEVIERCAKHIEEVTLVDVWADEIRALKG